MIYHNYDVWWRVEMTFIWWRSLWTLCTTQDSYKRWFNPLGPWWMMTTPLLYMEHYISFTYTDSYVCTNKSSGWSWKCPINCFLQYHLQPCFASCLYTLICIELMKWGKWPIEGFSNYRGQLGVILRADLWDVLVVTQGMRA